MPITSELHWAGSTGAFSKDSVEYTAVHRVFAENAQQQAQTILQWFTANVVQVHDRYAYASDTVGSFARAERISAERDLGGDTVWNVVVSYRPPAISQAEPTDDRDDNGNPTTNPLEWRFVLEGGNGIFTKPAYEAEYRSGFGSKIETDHALPPGSRTMPHNSAFVPLDPPLEKDVNTPWLRVQKNVAAWDAEAQEAYVNKVNQFFITVNRYGYSNKYQPIELRCEDASARFERRQTPAGEVEYWAATWFFAVRRRIRDATGKTIGGTWDDWVPDKGRVALASVGDPDGRGGFVAVADMVDGVPLTRRLVDSDLLPYTDEHFLDSEGIPVAYADGGGGRVSVKPTFIRWRTHQVADFRDIPTVGEIFDLFTP